MAHCTKCGAQVGAGAAYCQVCGERQPGAHDAGSGHDTSPAGAAPRAALNDPAASQSSSTPGVRSGLSENVAATLSYAAGWITGIVFLLIDKRPYVQFHAAQSIVVFGGLSLLRTVVGLAFGISVAFGRWGDWADWHPGPWAGYSAGGALLGLLSLTMFVLWLLLMVKAYQGECFRIPIAADVAESIAGKPTTAA